jgi:hypothetical protein
MLHGVDLWLVSDVPLTFEDGADRFSRNVGDYQSTLHNIPEEQRSLLHVGGRPKLRYNYLIISLRHFILLSV